MTSTLSNISSLRSAAQQVPTGTQVREAMEVRDAFSQFVGEAFFVQMFKAMRQTVCEPAYFHGGRGEEVFQSQLDQTMAEQMTQREGNRLSEAMFSQQFPQQAQVLKAAKAAGVRPEPVGLDRLGTLRRAI
jgi:Rod binding domain-containing protein